MLSSEPGSPESHTNGSVLRWHDQEVVLEQVSPAPAAADRQVAPTALPTMLDNIAQQTPSAAPPQEVDAAALAMAATAAATIAATAAVAVGQNANSNAEGAVSVPQSMGVEAMKAERLAAVVEELYEREDAAAAVAEAVAEAPHLKHDKRSLRRAINNYTAPLGTRIARRMAVWSIHSNRYLIEITGTFLLTLTALIVGGSQAVLGPIAVGSCLMAAVFAGGHISGGHFNPAVSLGVYISGRGLMKWDQLIMYWGSQFFGAFCGGLLAWYLTDITGSPLVGPNYTHGQAFVAEMIFSFFLVWVVLNVATTKSTEHNSFYGLAIGFTVLAGAACCSPISGGFFNPAIAIGGSLISDCINSSKDCTGRLIWIYLCAPLVGATAAALLYRFSSYTVRATDQLVSHLHSRPNRAFN